MNKTIIVNLDKLFGKEREKEQYRKLLGEVTEIFLYYLNRKDCIVSLQVENNTGYIPDGRFNGTIFCYTKKGYMIGFRFNIIDDEIKFWQAENVDFPKIFKSGKEVIEYVDSLLAK